MNGRFCLRCDWSGARTGRCPRCGEPLFHMGTATGPPPGRPIRAPAWEPEGRAPGPARLPAARASTSRAPIARAGRELDPSGPHPLTDPSPAPGRVRGLATSVVVVLVALVVAGWIAAHPGERPAARPRMPTGLTGTLVYAVDRGDGTSRLWRWDLRTGELRRGPDVASPIEMVDANAANPGWVGITSRTASGGMLASVLRFLEPQDRPIPLLRGDRVAWDGRGMTVAALREGEAATERCIRHIAIDLVRLTTSQRDRQFERGRGCGRVTTIGRATLVTFFSLARGGRTDVYFAGVQLHRVLRDHTMVSASPSGVLLVAPTARRSDALGGAEVLSGGIALYSGGLAVSEPIPFGTRDRPFEIERVLSWTLDSMQALVLGSWGDHIGLFMLDGGVGDGVEPPLYLGPVVSGETCGAFSERDVAFVADGSSLAYVRDGVLRSLRLPDGAPRPDGPIVWVP